MRERRHIVDAAEIELLEAEGFLRDVAPLAAGAQHIHHAVDYLAHNDSAFVAALRAIPDARSIQSVNSR